MYVSLEPRPHLSSLEEGLGTRLYVRLCDKTDNPTFVPRPLPDFILQLWRKITAKYIGSFRVARLPGQATHAAEPLCHTAEFP